MPAICLLRQGIMLIRVCLKNCFLPMVFLSVQFSLSPYPRSTGGDIRTLERV